MRVRLKLTALLILLSGISTASFAECPQYACHNGGMIPIPAYCPPIKCLKSGLYLGVGLGYDDYKLRQSLSLTTPTGAIFSFNPALAAKGWNGSLFAGYGQYYSWLYFAGEIFVNQSNASFSHDAVLGTAKYNGNFRARTSLCASFLPGIRLSRSTLLYGRVGYIRTTFKNQENFTAPPVVSGASISKYANGINVGIGIETGLYQNLSLRTEYDYTTYSAYMTTLGAKLSPANNAFTIGLIYHFDRLNYFAC